MMANAQKRLEERKKALNFKRSDNNAHATKVPDENDKQKKILQLQVNLY